MDPHRQSSPYATSAVKTMRVGAVGRDWVVVLGRVGSSWCASGVEVELRLAGLRAESLTGSELFAGTD